MPIFDLSSYDLTVFSLPLFITAAYGLILGLFVLLTKRFSPASVAFFLLALPLSIWFLCFGYMYAAQNESVALWWAKAAYIGIPFIAPAAYHFTLTALRLYDRYRGLSWIAWFGAGVFALLATSTNLLFDHVARYSWGYFPRYEPAGVLLPIFIVTFLALCLRHYWTTYRQAVSKPARSRRRRLLLTLLLGCVAAVDFAPAFGIPIYPFGFVGILCVLSVLAWAVWKRQLLDIDARVAAPQVIEMMADGLLVLNQQKHICLVNPAAVKMLGCPEAELLDKKLEDILTDADFAQHWAAMPNDGQTYEYEVKHSRNDGQTRFLQLTTSPAAQNGAARDATICLVHDITEQKMSAQALEKNIGFVGLLQSVAVAANEADTVREAMQACLDGVCFLTGWPIGHFYIRSESSNDELVSSNLWHVDDPSEYKLFRRVLASMRFTRGAGLVGEVFASGKPAWATDLLQQDMYLRARLAKDVGVHAAFAFPVLVGSEVIGVMEFYSNSTMEPDAAILDVMGHIGTQLGRVVERDRARDEIRRFNEDLEWRVHERTHDLEILNNDLQNEIAERKKAEAALHELATRDEVTGLLNRRELNRLLQEEAYRAQRYKRPMALLMIDIDHFKKVNDTHGHQVGDSVLRWVAQLLQNSTRASDRLARYGGEEMALILPEATAQDAFEIAEHLRTLIARQPFTYIDVDGRILEVHLTVSIGVAPIGGAIEEEEALIRAADSALYAAKHKGRNQSVQYSADLTQRHMVDKTHSGEPNLVA